MTAELLRTFDLPIHHEQGSFRAQVIGRPAADGGWEGWLEFLPLSSDKNVVVSAVESRQPAREYLVYWAQGLTEIFAEGSLERALHPIVVHSRVVEVPISSEPAKRAVVTKAPDPTPEAVLDPFDIGGRNLDILRQQLHALNRPRLVNIIAAYDLNPSDTDLSPMTDAELIGFILAAVEIQLTHQSPR